MSANVLSKLWVELGLDTAAFEGDVGKAAHLLNQKLDGVKDAAGKLGTAVGAGLAAGATAFAALAMDAINAADEMDNLSARAGVSVEELSRLAYAAKMSDTDTQALATGVRKLQENMVSAAAGSAAQRAAFESIGVSVADANGKLRASDEVMKDVATRFSQFEDGAVKSALATDIFGKAGNDLIPMLNEGREGIEALGAEASAMGIVLSDQVAKDAAAFNDNLDKARATVGGMVSRVTAEMLPTFVQLSGQLAQTAKDSGFLDNVARGLATTFKLVVSGGIMVKAVLTAIGEGIGQTAAALAEVAQGNFRQAMEIFSDTSGTQDFLASMQNIRSIWVETGVAAQVAGAQQAQALRAAPAYAPGGAKSGKGGGGKAAKDNFGYKSENWMDAEIGALSAEQDASNAAYLAQEKAKAIADLTVLQESLMTKRDLEMQEQLHKANQIQAAVDLEVLQKHEGQILLENLTRDHKQRLAGLDKEEVAGKKANLDRMVGFVANSLSAIGKQNSVAARAAVLLSRATALQQIAADTPTAAVAAAKAVAGIPYVGPALAVVAKASMYALGSAAAANVVSGGMGGGGGGGISIPSSAASTVTPAAQVSAANAEPQQATIIKVPEDRMMTGRQMVDFMGEVLGDGYQSRHFQFMAVPG